MSNFTIRPAQTRDLHAIGQIAEKTELFPAHMLQGMSAGYFDKTKQDIWFVGEQSGDVITFGFCEPERMTEGTWNLLAIGVQPEFQGKGHGTHMMAYIESVLKQTHQRILLVETMGTPDFERTRQFYRNNNYTEEARIREFYAAGADKVVFWKHL